MIILLWYLVQAKYIKIHQQAIPSIDRNALEFFCVFPYIQSYSNFHKVFRVSSTYGAKVEYYISSFYSILFLCYADRQMHTHTHRPIAKKVVFEFKGSQNININPSKCQF